MKLGDLTEKLISITTLGQGKKIATYVAKLRGKEDCGCNKRKTILNNLNMKSTTISETSFALDWSEKWKEIRSQVSCACKFDYAILLIKDEMGGVLYEEKLSAAPYMNGQARNKTVSLPTFFTPHSYSLKFHKKEENEFINPVEIEL